MASSPPSGRRISIVGAGPSGLVAARELRRKGLDVVVFERGASIGGMWVYTGEVESDPLGLDPCRRVVHSSVYSSMRLNVPRELMGFLDYPFGDGEGEEVEDPRRFPLHREVLRYLEDFVTRFHLMEVIKLKREVVSVEMVEEDKRWRVRTIGVAEGKKEEEEEEEIFDAVIVCCGHFSQPVVAHISGIESWPGKQMHSHNYRVPELFNGQVVAIIGNGASSIDISREILQCAKEVHVACRSDPCETPRKNKKHDNMWHHSMVEKANEDGTLSFKDGSTVYVDVILYCTGYRYDYPFLKTGGVVTVDDNRVGPLYKHVFPPSLAPGLSFVGVPSKVIPFMMLELQSKWIAGVLSKEIDLPSEEEMMRDIQDFYSWMDASGHPKRHTHDVFPYEHEYDDWLALKCGYPVLEEWVKEMSLATHKNRQENPDTYRDIWFDHHLVEKVRAAHFLRGRE